ncbi:MBL fold metallo-hydrolase [Bacterioplanoides sp.]|uniref:MBL fold metallo-hydrolase n=1 Tax=Bacterioplanoides sp. TaxID=2066072 RepID=UPI003AFF6D4C
MKSYFQKTILMIGLLLSVIATAQPTTSSQTFEAAINVPIGGETWGHSIKPIGNGIYVFRWWVYRSFFVITDEGVIAADPINPKAAKLMQAEIRKRTDKPVKYVVYSHNHHDHISGGTVFQKEGARYVGHSNLLKELKDHPSPAIPMPDITFDKSYTLTLGGRTLKLEYFGPNHGNSLVVMRFPQEKILFVVDIVTPRRVAFRNMPDFWPDEWVRTLKELEQLDIDYVIAAHGPETQPAIDPASVITEQREYIEDLMLSVKTAMDNGIHSPDKLRQTIKLPKYEHWRSYDKWLPMNVERIWAYYHMGW